MRNHIAMIKNHSPLWERSNIIVYVEFNLGFEAEHHEKALSDIPDVYFRVDMHARRVGFLTTQSTKHAGTELMNVMLREMRIKVIDKLISKEPAANRIKLREQAEVFSYQYKQAENVFSKERIALTGKVGGMCDDIIMMVIMGNYMTAHDIQHGKIPIELP